MEHIKLKKYYILELVAVILLTVISEFINQYYYAGVFKNFIFIINIILICLLIRSLLIDKYKINLVKINVSLILIMIFLLFFTLPEYTYEEAREVVLEQIQKEGINASIDESIEYKSIIGKYTPSTFVSRWYTIEILENKEEKYYYFNPESGEFFKGEKRKNSNSGITNMPENVK